MNLDFTKSRNSGSWHYHIGALAAWVVGKYREQARQNGVQAVARNLRKQGVPLRHAVTILARQRPGL